MSLRKLPAPAALVRPKSYNWDADPDAYARWTASPQAAEADDPDTISIYDVIGQDWWTGEGFTAKRMAGALRAIGAKPVAVKINSPGGDMFEGLAIYNLLREHPAEVTVKVMGLAASAASIIAMAGDRVEMGLGSFLMIHNSWGAVVGNQNDFTEAAKIFAQFDSAMADIYAARTGLDAKAVAKLMDSETWLTARDAVDQNFADAVVDQPADPSSTSQARAEQSARRRIDSLLQQSGLPRSERRRLLRELGTPGAADADDDTPRAVFDEQSVQNMLAALRG